MLNGFRDIRNSLSYRLIFCVGLTLFVIFSIWSYINIEYQKEKMMNDIVIWTDRLSQTIHLSMHYSMMLNARNEINQSIQNIGRQKAIEHIRIYNKEGEIKFSSMPLEVNQKTDIQAEACYICHKSDPPLDYLDLPERIRIVKSPQGHRVIGVITPIRNEFGCATDACHVHPEDKKILGALDVVVSLKETDADILFFEEGILILAGFIFIATSIGIGLFVFQFVKMPIRKLIEGTRRIGSGDYFTPIDVNLNDEIGELAAAFEKMGQRIGEKQTELNNQRDEYQRLFEQVPCIISVQDRNYRLIQFNHEFSERFGQQIGQPCYLAYKGRNEKCIDCPVELTFADGLPHNSEETGINIDGTKTCWMVRTSPIKNAEGQIIGAMEMSIDISRNKQLEEKLAESGEKYYAIFNNSPNAIFVLDMQHLTILECNQSVTQVYGYPHNELIGKSFLDLFLEEERELYAFKLLTSSFINRARHSHRNGGTLFVNIRFSSYTYSGQKMLLVTSNDITKRLEAEQQLFQASKMATLGEMATGVAHELNQPLSVIKTASSFFMKKIDRNEPIKEDILYTLAKEIDSHVDRATKIITHMRQFGRKTEMTLERIQLNDIVKKAIEIFSQQLKARGIQVIWDIQPDIPQILADPSRLEQVFINLILNARDAIEQKLESGCIEKSLSTITIKTVVHSKTVSVSISDTGTGIPISHLDKIFEPFYTTKNVGKGTGLGLSISYGIVQECRGSIHAVNNDDGGATFIITFPIPEG